MIGVISRKEKVIEIFEYEIETEWGKRPPPPLSQKKNYLQLLQVQNST